MKLTKILLFSLLLDMIILKISFATCEIQKCGPTNATIVETDRDKNGGIYDISVDLDTCNCVDHNPKFTLIYTENKLFYSWDIPDSLVLCDYKLQNCIVSNIRIRRLSNILIR